MTRPSEQPKKVIVFGASGLLGPYICHALEAHGYTAIPVGKSNASTSCDLTDAATTKAFIDSHNPFAVVNLVALTNVDLCEDQPEIADSINRLTVENIVKALQPETQLIHISTDQVYSEASSVAAPYTEDATYPINAYGRTKLEGEQEAMKHPRALVLRTNIFGASQTDGRKSLSDFFIQSFQNQTPMTLFTDSIFTPLHMTTVGEVVSMSLAKGLTGVYNLASRDGMSKADFALKIAEFGNFSTENTKQVASTTVAGRAPRPLDLRMSTTAFEKAFGMTMPTLEQEILKACAHLK